MQAVFREYEEWLGDEEMLKYITRGFKKAEEKLEMCLPYEEALVNINHLNIYNTYSIDFWENCEYSFPPLMSSLQWECWKGGLK